jgi:phenylacetate-coenzyme A ligase PaaK-like adenylate-forming protein
MSLTNTIQAFMQNNIGDFNQLALEVFAHQYTHCEAYQRYCQELKLTPTTVDHWHDIPSVPTDVFREFDLCTFDPAEAKYVFETSGTTQDEKGRHFYQDMTLYDEAIRQNFMRGIGLKNAQSITFRILTPAFNEVKTSSLFYMLQRAVEWYGDANSRFYMANNQMDYNALIADVAEDIQQNRPIALIGTAFSFVNLFDDVKDLTWQLPVGSVLMETGGLKGRAREIAQDELYQLFQSRLGLTAEHCFSEYGMTELSSQCYSKPGSHIFTSPHWMPVRIVDAETGNDVNVGETGIVQFYDLANVDTISAITTADLAIKHAEGFELLGRAPLAVLRGCSTQFEEL